MTGTHPRYRHWPTIVRIASILAPIQAVVLAIVGVVMYTTADSQPELRTDAYAPAEMIDIPGAYRWDGMVLWGTPADVDLSRITCRVGYTTRERQLRVGPREADRELARHTDPTHGPVAYLASTVTVLGQPSTATCEGDGLERIFISADRDDERATDEARLMLAVAATLLLLGLVMHAYSRSLNARRRRREGQRCAGTG